MKLSFRSSRIKFNRNEEELKLQNQANKKKGSSKALAGVRNNVIAAYDCNNWQKLARL